MAVICCWVEVGCLEVLLCCEEVKLPVFRSCEAGVENEA